MLRRNLPQIFNQCAGKESSVNLLIFNSYKTIRYAYFYLKKKITPTENCFRSLLDVMKSREGTNL